MKQADILFREVILYPAKGSLLMFIELDLCRII